MYLAIITARGGSKRIPRKNIRPFHGKPMIAWPIATARESGCFDRVIVSTDDVEIAVIAERHGAEAPFLRPKELADDFCHAHRAARHALEWFLAEQGPVEAFCHIYATAPFLGPETIRQGLGLIQQGATNAYAMLRVPFPVYQMMIRNTDGALMPLFPPDKVAMRSQDMPTAFIDAGQMYWYRTEYFLERETAVGTKTAIVEVSRETALDIDTEEDWAFAEKMAALIRRG